LDNMDEARPPVTPSCSLRAGWARMRQRRWFRWATDLAMFGLIFGGVQAVQSLGLVGAGDPAPDFALTTVDGEAVSLSGLKGKKTVLAFWAPWCSVCQVESASLSKLQEGAGEDYQVVSVVLGYEGSEDVRAFMNRHGVDYPVLMGDRGIADDYAVSKFPTLYVLDEDGRVEHSTVGYTSTLGMRWRLWF
jgi:peroxiredoxin